MYIEPSTSVRLCKNVPLDNTYRNTIYFENATAQGSFFASKEKKFIPKNTYQRQGIGVIRLEVAADDIYDCNYMCFQNTNFGSKWFYAFITNVEYVNNIVSEISYELDVMQTWMFDYTLKPSFVAREHVSNDEVGVHRVPENLELGDFTAEDFDGTGVMGHYSIVVAAPFDSNYGDGTASIDGGLCNALFMNTFDHTSSGAAACSNFIKGAAANADNIVAVFLMDKAFVTTANSAIKTYEITKPKFTDLKRRDGNPVHNKKLLTYPYNFLYVTNLQGQAMVYKYEEFPGELCKFQLAGDMTCNPSVYLTPIGYELEFTAVPNFDQRLVLTNYPQLSYTVDSFKAWLAQTATSAATNALTTAMSAGMAAAGAPAIGGSGPAMSAAVGGAEGLATALPSMAIQATLKAVGSPNAILDAARGGTSGAATSAAIGIMDFCFMHKHIRPEYVSIIDDYFDMYGYQINRVKVPDITSRPHWNYIQTIGCTAIGSVPADSMRKIISIYDNGITFWKNGNEVGDYTLDNTIGG